MMHFVIEGLVNNGAILEHNLSVFDIARVEPSQGMLHPILIITFWEILVRLSTTRLLAVLGGNHFLYGLVHKILKLKGFDEVGVPNHAAILDANVFVLLHDIVNDDHSRLHVFRVAVHWSIFL